MKVTPNPSEWKYDSGRIVWIDRHLLMIRTIAYMDDREGLAEERAKFLINCVHSYKALCEALEFYADTKNLHEFIRSFTNMRQANGDDVADTYGISDDVCLKAREALKLAGWSPE